MPDQVTSQILEDGPHNAVILFTNQSDGSGEAAALKVDASTLSGAPASVKIARIKYATHGMAVQLLWDGPTDRLAWLLPPDMADDLNFEDMGGLQNSIGADKTGDINATTVGASAGDSYTIILWLKKKA